MALAVQHLMDEALQEFQDRLHSELPLTRLRHTSEFCSDEGIIKKVAQRETTTVSKKFMDNISALGARPDKIGNHVKKLCGKIQKYINDCIAKNRNNRTKSESFLQQRIDRVCEDFKSSMGAKLILNPEMDMKAFENLAVREKNLGVKYFEGYWNHGNERFFFKHQKKLKAKMNKLKGKIIHEYRLQMTTPAPENQDEVEKAEVNGNPSVASNVNEVVHVEAVVPGDTDSNPDSTIKTTPGIKSQNEVETNTGQLQAEPEENGSQPECLVETEAQSNGVKRNGLELEEGELISGCSSSPSKRPRLSETPIPGSSAASDGTCEEMRDPLIFYLASKRISMGTKIGSKFEQLRDQTLYPCVAVNENGRLVVGEEALKFPEYCMLENCLQGSSSERKKLSFKIGEEMVNQEVHLEFLLGLLLKTMKDSAESHLKQSFRTAIITVPMWFCSSQRLQIKDAALIAGFDKANVVNQETVAVYAYYASKLKGGRDSEVLVLAHNFGILSGVLFQNLKMVRDVHRRSERNEQYASRWDKWHLISTSLKTDQCDSNSNNNGSKLVKTMLGVADSYGWSQTFRNFAKISEYKFSYFPAASSLFGASIFCEKRLEEVYTAVSQYLPCKLQPYGADEPTKLLGEPVVCKLPMKDFLKPNSPRIVQESVRDGEMVPVGEVEFRGSAKYPEEYYQKAFMSSMLILNFKMDSEAIVSLERMEVEELEGKENGSSGSEVLLAEDFSWKTPELKEEERENMRRLVNSIWQWNKASALLLPVLPSN